VDPAVVAAFDREYMAARAPWTTRWRGVDLTKSPTDLWVYSELIWQIRPGTIIETGTHRGGSALWLADMLDLFGIDGHVYSIDLLTYGTEPTHPRLTYIKGDSVTVDVPDPADGPVMVILDSDHSEHHVHAEMLRFAPMVTVGSYLIVEDTNVPLSAPELPGDAFAAVRRFLTDHDGFVVDRGCERYGQTCNPGGFLRRVA
jgi:cephalosporin hydroxylase